MKCWSVAVSRADGCRWALTGAGLALLFGLSASSAWAANAAEMKPPVPVPAKAAPPAKPRLKAAVGPAECIRTGQRVIAALARDDSGAANQFHTFYTAFKCPPQHLAQAFGCLVGLQTKSPNLSNPSPEQVAQCWEDPATIPEVKPQPEPQPPAQPK